MKNKILVKLSILFLLGVNSLYAQSITTKQLYRGGVYGQTFEITEYTDGEKCRLLITMSDNKTKIHKFKHLIQYYQQYITSGLNGLRVQVNIQMQLNQVNLF